MTATTSVPKRDIYAQVTSEIIDAIERGAGEFRMPWHRRGDRAVLPRNAITGMPYRGINTLTLWTESTSREYGSPLWATYRQWRKVGAQVRRGETASFIVFYEKKAVETTESEGEPSASRRKTRWIVRGYGVFNVAQVDGRDAIDEAPAAIRSVDELDALVATLRADVRHGGDRAYYNRLRDHIQMPDRSLFCGTEHSTPTESYYATLLHEHVHWSGHGERLNRDLTGKFGGFAYAMEELIAELGAAFLCAEFGFGTEPRMDHAAYMGSWLQVLRDKKRAVFTAATAATVACRFLTKHAGVIHTT